LPSIRQEPPYPSNGDPTIPIQQSKRRGAVSTSGGFLCPSLTSRVFASEAAVCQCSSAQFAQAVAFCQLYKILNPPTFSRRFATPEKSRF